MRRGLTVAMAAPIALTMARAVTVDRIAVSAGNRVITDSEISLRLRLTAFENGEKPEFSLSARKQAAQRLIDQRLVEREMDVGHFPRLAEDQIKGLLEGYAKENYHGDNEALNRALEGAGLTPRDLEEDLARQSDLLTFLTLRFRPAVQVSDRDVQQYFRDKIEPSNPGMPLNDFRARIEQQMTNDRADADMEAWLRDQRKRTKIVYHEKELAPEAAP